MNAENIQQERSYHEFIQNLSSLSKEIKEDDSFTLLFDEIKKENKSIYNAVVDFNIVKFSIEHPYWDEDENKNKACEVILQECDKIKEAAQKLGDKAKRKLEREVREKLKGYIEGGVKEDGVKIYGNHASITLEDNKKKFEISEFLNSDFCQKNGISGFSTLHSDGKSGMHGFVAEEGGRKIRHYVVTDGSYEMTLIWYVNGEKCTVTININADGSVERIGGHDVSEEQLRANKDVKIGNLYLYEVLAKGRWKEVNKPSFEAAIKKDVEKPIQENKAANTTQETGSQTPPPPPPRTSSLPPKKGLSYQDGGQKMEFDKYIQGNTLDLHKLDSINIPELLEFLNKERDIKQINLGWNSIDDEDAEKLLRQRGLIIMENRHEEENSQNKKTPPPLPLRTSSLPPKKGLSYQDGGQSELSSNVTDIAQKRFTENVLEKIKEEKPIYKWLKDKIEGKENNQNLDALEEKLSKKYSQDNTTEKRESDDSKPLSPTSTGGNTDVKHISDTQPQKNSHRSGQEPEEEERNFQKISEALESWKEKRRNARQSNSSSSSPIHASHDESQLNPKQSKASLMDVEQAVTPENSNNEFKETLSEGPGTEERIEVSSNKVCNEPIDEKLKSVQPIDQADQAMDELEKVLKKPDKGLTKSAQQVIEKNTSRDPFSENVLENIKEGKRYNPIRKYLQEITRIKGQENNQDLNASEENPSQESGQDNIITATTKLSAAFSELCTEAQESFAKRKRIKQPRIEQVIKQQQERDKGVSI